MNDIKTPKKSENYISMQGINKSFPGVQANVDIHLDINKYEIHALLGENGAGKSTLMKILYGFYGADSGEIIYQGKPYQIRSPQDARAIKIGMVFQDLNLIPALSVAENIALFLQDLPHIYQPRKIADLIDVVSHRYSLHVNPDTLVSQLSVGEQQKVEILKLLLSDARLLILDEPTRVLAPHELEGLFKVLGRLRDDGYAIILITHKMNEVMECADRVTVLRKGRVVGSVMRSEVDENNLIEMMFAKKISSLQIPVKANAVPTDTPILELTSVSTAVQGMEMKLRDIDLNIHPGEIVGVAGVSGNGQKELTDLVLGMISCASGNKKINGEDVTHLSIPALRKRGVVYIPENPLAMATVPFMTVLENFSLPNTWRYIRYGGLMLDWVSVRKDALSAQETMGFEIPLYTMAKSLSGGNLQRAVIAREMSHKPRLIIASYLTRGLDVQSTNAARAALIQAKQDGAGVLLISEDLDELFLLSDRLIVLYQGRIVGEFSPKDTNIYEIGHLMTGSEVLYETEEHRE